MLREVQTEDLLKFGLIPEFVGRLPVVATLEELDAAALVKILTEPKNALVKQYQKLLELEGVNAADSPRAPCDAIAEVALARKSGARGLRSILETAMLDIMYDIPSRETIVRGRDRRRRDPERRRADDRLRSGRERVVERGAMAILQGRRRRPERKASGPRVVGRACTFPLLPLRDIVVFPHMVVPLFVGREKSVRALEEAMQRDRNLLLSAQRDAKTDDPGRRTSSPLGHPRLHRAAGEAPDGTVKVLVEGKRRARIVGFRGPATTSSSSTSSRSRSAEES